MPPKGWRKYPEGSKQSGEETTTGTATPVVTSASASAPTANANNALSKDKKDATTLDVSLMRL